MPASSSTSSKGTKRRRKQVSSESSEDEIDAQTVPVEEREIDKIQDVSNVLSTMTDDEMAQHLKLCMKLSAENKINMKNAFGLHLIEIMQKMVKNNARADIQQASLSLQASSKIYAGRVEALYQETCKFHGHLQSILSGGKKDKKSKESEDVEEVCDDFVDPGSKKNKPPKKCKSYLKPEEALHIESAVDASSGEPHGNFAAINAAFSTSRLAPKLLRSLQLVNDSCIMKCATAEPCFKPRVSLKNEPYVVSQKLEGLLEKIKSLNISEADVLSLSSSDNVFPPTMSTPCTASRALLFGEDSNHFDPGPADSSLMPPPNTHDVMDAVDGFDDLNITVDAFVNDISAAVTNSGVDHNLLPPGSALKRMLNNSRRSSIRPPSGKSIRKKTKEPFFVGKDASSVKHLFIKGRGSTISQRILSEWTIENTSIIDLGYEFIEDLDGGPDPESEDSLIKVDQIFDIIKQNDIQYYFKSYFHKESQLWKVSRRKMCLDLSFPGTPFRSRPEMRHASLAPNEPEALAVSLQNLSLHESMLEPPVDGDVNASYSEGPQAFSDAGEPEFLVPSEPYEEDIDDLMVKPPDLVRPMSMKFDQRPVNLDTDKMKKLLWMIISKYLETNQHLDKSSEPFVLFSEAYEELKLKLEREISEFVSMQFAFVVLLILANEKTLLIEDHEDKTDIRIKQDLCEIETPQTS